MSIVGTWFSRIVGAAAPPPPDEDKKDDDIKDKPRLRVGTGGEVPVFPPLAAVLCWGAGAGAWMGTGRRLALWWLWPERGGMMGNNSSATTSWPLLGGRLVVTAGVLYSSLTTVRACKTALEEAGTSPNFKHVPQITERGPFARRRNSMYLALVSLTATLSITFNSAWFLASAAVLWSYLNYVVIPAEERYLKGQFGVAYDDYCRRVPRWF
eukprot:CAMPEP_0168739654 /NCGR_PEP_ID=MMETSP0724-20121128/11576_1 /TAXON_ID=265536 /ORGANISM="Amphiprora sp., Strain CCMP467" /LENGTH=210 /DNA_ID=CAMNT_0008787067 /DNA_START=47 /DNA_END=679 /DNA_ORIENTATION=-